MSITAWRIVAARHAATAMTGDGARLYPGRWNHRGTPLVYTAASMSLAALELLVHAGSVDRLADHVCIPVTFDADLCEVLREGGLPPDWADHPAPSYTRDLGARWVAEARSPVLAVPSAVIQIETNYILNPRHPDFGKIRIGAARPFRFDPRLG